MTIRTLAEIKAEIKAAKIELVVAEVAYRKEMRVRGPKSGKLEYTVGGRRFLACWDTVNEMWENTAGRRLLWDDLVTTADSDSIQEL